MAVTGNTVSFGPCFKELWINSSPASSFSAQDITLSQDALDFDFLLVDYMFSTSSPDHSTLLIAVEDMNVANRVISLRINAGRYNRTGARDMTFKVESGATVTTKIHFGAAAYDTNTSNNSYVLPYRIYGIKF